MISINNGIEMRFSCIKPFKLVYSSIKNCTHTHIQNSLWCEDWRPIVSNSVLVRCN